MTDTQWRVVEVFHQQSRGEPHVHVGAIHAPDAETAIVMAKEQYGRRQACVSLWVVPSDVIEGTRYEDVDMFEHGTNKAYREAYGYQTTKRVRAQTTKRPRSEREPAEAGEQK